MSRYLQSVAMLAVVLGASPAIAGDGISGAYASFFAGGSLPSATITAYDPIIPVGISFDVGFGNGYIVGGTLGATLLPNLRGEAEFSVVNSEITELMGIPAPDDASVTSVGYNFLGNLWYDVDTGSSFTPYVGGGVGYGYDVATTDGSSEELNTSGFLYQLGLGVRFAATDKIGFDLGYRYRVQPDADITGDGLMIPDDAELKSSATNHIVQGGVTVGF